MKLLPKGKPIRWSQQDNRNFIEKYGNLNTCESGEQRKTLNQDTVYKKSKASGKKPNRKFAGKSK